MSVALRPAPLPAAVTRMPLTDALALGPAAWELLEMHAATPSPFMSWAWHRAWTEAAPTAEVAASEALLLRGTDGRIQAMLPVLSRRVPFHRVPINALTWATGDMGCPDRVDVLALPDSSIAEFAESLEALSWEVLILSNLASDAEMTGRLCKEMASRGYEIRRHKLWVCPYLALPGNWDQYLGTLTPTRRQTLRRKERQLAREHAFTITDYTGDRVDEGMAHLFSLHGRRWQDAGQGGALASPAVQRLHRRFAAELAARGKLWLSTLDIAGKPVAAWYGFAWRDTVYFYQSGRDPQWERQSVGLVLMGTMIRRAIAGGYARFDFLRGADSYKQQWTATQRSTEEIMVFRRGFGGRVLRALDALGALRGRLRRNAERWD